MVYYRYNYCNLEICFNGLKTTKLLLKIKFFTLRIISNLFFYSLN